MKWHLLLCWSWKTHFLLSMLLFKVIFTFQNGFKKKDNCYYGLKKIKKDNCHYFIPSDGYPSHSAWGRKVRVKDDDGRLGKRSE